jgi:FkbM family methyltransferase
MKSHKKIKSKISSNVMTLSVKEKRLKFYYKNKMQLSNAFSILYEIFVKEQYGQLDVKNKQVVDIGASLGDAAMYFSIKGARHVYSFELYPSLYDFGIKNVKANNLRNITLLNEGCGAKESTIEIDKKQESTIFGSVRKTHYGKKVKITTLRDIVNKYKIEDAALKIDCEGCEYGIILESKIETLRKFDNMIIEYHKGYKNLIDKLESAGFECKKTLPKELKDSATKIFYIGFIYAKRKDNWGHG